MKTVKIGHLRGASAPDYVDPHDLAAIDTRAQEPWLALVRADGTEDRQPIDAQGKPRYRVYYYDVTAVQAGDTIRCASNHGPVTYLVVSKSDTEMVLERVR